MTLPTNDLEVLIPQRAPFVCISSLDEADPDGTVETAFTIPAGHVLLEDGHLSAEGLVENIAQSAAAGLGYASVGSGEPPAIGYIAAISDLKVNSLPPVGSTIRTVIETERQVLNVTIIVGRSFLEDRQLAECHMKIFVHDE